MKWISAVLETPTSALWSINVDSGPFSSILWCWDTKVAMPVHASTGIFRELLQRMIRRQAGSHEWALLDSTDVTARLPFPNKWHHAASEPKDSEKWSKMFLGIWIHCSPQAPESVKLGEQFSWMEVSALTWTESFQGLLSVWVTPPVTITGCIRQPPWAKRGWKTALLRYFPCKKQ